MRILATTIAALALFAALLAACGGGSDGGTAASSPTEGAPPSASPSAPAGASVRTCETGAADVTGLRSSATACSEARAVLLAWQRNDGCAAAPGASHSACSVRGYRCIGSVAGAGLAVSCARRGRAVSFLAARD